MAPLQGGFVLEVPPGEVGRTSAPGIRPPPVAGLVGSRCSPWIPLLKSWFHPISTLPAALPLRLVSALLVSVFPHISLLYFGSSCVFIALSYLYIAPWLKHAIAGSLSPLFEGGRASQGNAHI